MSGNDGKPVAILGRYSGSSTTYQKVVMWKIGQIWELDHGNLRRIDLASDTYAKTNFRLTVLGKLLFKDMELPAALTLVFPDNKLPRGEEIKVEAKSTDGTAIVVTIALTGSEF